MKVVIAWLAALALAAITASSCAIRHKSADYQCTQQADCADIPGSARQCLNGYCVIPGATDMIDAPRSDGPLVDAMADAMVDATMCPSQCTSCNIPQMTCTIDCQTTNCTQSQIVCPTGWKCAIACNTPGACANGVNCNTAKSCALNCSGQGSCHNVQCGTGDCNVQCTGNNSCRTINCANSCACDVTCGQNATCSGLTCSSFACDPPGPGCTSQGLGCDVCLP